MKVVTRIAAGLTLVLAFFGSFTLVSMMIDREPPVAYENARALQTEAHRGGTLDVEFKVFRTRICPIVAKRWMTDSEGARHAIPSFTVGVQQLAGRETYQRSITIPTAAALGPASYQVNLSYTCNIFHRLGWPIVVDSPPITFNIVP